MYRLDRPVINGKRSSKWYIIWTEPGTGRSKRRSTFTADHSAAERVLAEYVAAFDAPPPKFDIAMLIDAYLAEHPNEGDHAKAVKRLLGRLSVPSLTPGQIRMFHRSRRAEGASDSTINRQCRVLRAALNFGWKEGWITLADIPHIAAPKPAPPRNRWLSEKECLRLYEGAGSEHLKTFIILALHTAQRANAILSLTWDQVEDRIVRFPQTTSSKRNAIAVPINTTLGLRLGTARLMADSDYVISYAGERVGSVKKAFQRAVSRAKLKDVRIHDLRRTAATRLLQNGGTFEQAALLLNDNVKTVQRHYGYASDDLMGDATRRMEG